MRAIAGWHTLLGIGDHEALLAHPVAGASREGPAIESLLAAAPLHRPGSHLACEAVQSQQRLVVHGGGVERFPIADGVDALSLPDLCEELSAARVAPGPS